MPHRALCSLKSYKLKLYTIAIFMPRVGRHIAVELSVRPSVCPSENFNVGHNFCNIEDSNLIFGMHVYLMKLHILIGKVQGQGHPLRSNVKKLNQGNYFPLKREIIFKPAKRYIEILYMKPNN